MYDLTQFSLADMTRCGAALRKLGKGATSMELAARKIVHYLREHLVHAEKARSCPLVRFYKTHPYDHLDSDMQAFAQRVLGEKPTDPSIRCLTLLASVGEEEAWNDRARSSGHRAIPLPSPEIVSRFPMIANLISQFGLEASMVVKPDPSLLVDLDQRTYNVFHVPEAEASPYIPAQEDFVRPYHIRSALGFGGMLPSGHLFAVVLFTTIPIPHETAELFRTLALSAKMAVLPFDGGTVFEPAS